MTKSHITILTDDLDGTELAEGKGETVMFGFDGRNYEIDLSNKNAKDLRKRLERYVAAGRRVGRSGRSRRARRASTARSDTAAIREWARQQGLQVSDRGRIPADVVDAYQGSR